ncbi:MAG: SusF/SusE family outer membrane protein [Lewinellaceae bacterium]|nr:SusF/SusE family outer membrane protein [Phaeodactylibacter sp.]MCB9040680.1 SusF/SusE family outer membrane protein [Lewinellaceae bacterium]
MKIIKLLSLLLGIVLIALSCSKDKLDGDALTDLPPGILSITPADKSKVVVGDFDIKVLLADGVNSPLASATVTLSDEFGNMLGTKTSALSGTRDSIVLEGSEFGAELLGPGGYVIDILATDASGNEVNRKTTFEISLLPFAANNDVMYIAGGFNGWGADEMALVGDYTWEVVVDIQGGEFKLKNTPDWTDQDWGDGNCDGIMEVTTGGGPNTPAGCAPSGEVKFRFNDQTLAYSILPTVEFETKLSGLYLLGSFNNFEGSQYKFNLVADNTWELPEVELKTGDKFKFAEGPNFMGRNWGDNDGDGIAEEFGSNIMFMEQGAFYSITFNEKSLEYTLTFQRFPSIGIIGSATPGGWDNDTNMTDNGDGTFSILIDLIDGEAKFRANDSWDVNWGGTDWPSGIASLNGPNIPVTAGLYDVTFNPSTGEYSFEENAGIVSVGIIGSATPGGWDSDTNMKDNGDGTYTLLIGLLDGEAKFRANDDWPINWGGAGFPSGTGEQDGPNIPVTQGLYLVTFDSNTGEYNFGPASVGIIGSATPGGWDSDTDMTPDATDPNVVKVTLDLVDGEAKFRLNNDWPTNWGGADFPSGTGTQDGPNIPVAAGTYDISFNVLTGEYNFQ